MQILSDFMFMYGCCFLLWLMVFSNLLKFYFETELKLAFQKLEMHCVFSFYGINVTWQSKWNVKIYDFEREFAVKS